jgi:hypothetical protein
MTAALIAGMPPTDCTLYLGGAQFPIHTAIFKMNGFNHSLIAELKWDKSGLTRFEAVQFVIALYTHGPIEVNQRNFAALGKIASTSLWRCLRDLKIRLAVVLSSPETDAWFPTALHKFNFMKERGIQNLDKGLSIRALQSLPSTISEKEYNETTKFIDAASWRAMMWKFITTTPAASASASTSAAPVVAPVVMGLSSSIATKEAPDPSPPVMGKVVPAVAFSHSAPQVLARTLAHLCTHLFAGLGVQMQRSTAAKLQVLLWAYCVGVLQYSMQ